jgi:hypothetical protein
MFILASGAGFADPIRSPAWGFRLDLPAGYGLDSREGNNSFSFSSLLGTNLDTAVYQNKTIETLAGEINQKLSNHGETEFFEYNGKKAALIELDIRAGNPRLLGWALCVELTPQAGIKPALAVLSYGERADAALLHLSILDSVCAGDEDPFIPGPVTSFAWPRGKLEEVRLAGNAGSALFCKNDAEAAQSLVDREFFVLKLYAESELWQEALLRFYRAIYRDSFDRLKYAAFSLERFWLVDQNKGGTGESREARERVTGEKALAWVQSFTYERDRTGSDFVNLVSAATEGRGDCDSRAMLWAIILEQANISAAIMVSREYSHAMGLALIAGTGARFPMNDAEGVPRRWLVAETTSAVQLGQIEKEVSQIDKWLGVLFE